MQKGLTGSALRDALNGDVEYQGLLDERKANLRKKFELSEQDEAKYVLSTDSDYEILSMCRHLAKKDLTESDRALISFIESQIELDWRKHLTDKIKLLHDKYE